LKKNCESKFVTCSCVSHCESEFVTRSCVSDSETETKGSSYKLKPAKESEEKKSEKRKKLEEKIKKNIENNFLKKEKILEENNVKINYF